MEQQAQIACKLTSAELQQRRIEVLQRFKAEVTRVTELENGFRYEFPSTSNQIVRLGNLIELEHACCPFLRFQLTVEPGNGPAVLELTGPDGMKDFLTALFGE